MYTHQVEQDQADWNGTDIQWGGGTSESDYTSPGKEDHGQRWEEGGMCNVQGTAITFYDQERQKWGKSNKRGGDKGTQEGGATNMQGGSYEEQIRKEYKEPVIQGRVINNKSQATIRQEEDRRKSILEGLICCHLFHLTFKSSTATSPHLPSPVPCGHLDDGPSWQVCPR